MSCYIVSFEATTEASAKQITERLQTFGSFCPINKFCWAIITDKKAVEIRDLVGASLPATDRIFVLRSGTEAAWQNSYGEKNSEWLKKNL